jgi:hypothetical protein
VIVGVGASCANANAPMKPDARMTQLIFIGGSYPLLAGPAQTGSLKLNRGSGG